MSDHYPPNSHQAASAQPARPKNNPIVTNVRIRKKSWGSRVADRGSSIWKDILMEVVGPHIRDLFATTFHAITDRALYPESPGLSQYRVGRPGQSSASHISPTGYVVTDYNAQYVGGGQPTAQQLYGTPARPFDFSIFIIPDYARGKEIIDRLRHNVIAYGHATVNDLYELFDKTGDHVGENYGWEGLEVLDATQVRRVRGGGGFYLDIPDAKPLKK